ncbi:MAG: FtsK/SpoIIIE domain-containing protein [Anaerolineae bacterium]
MNRSLIVVLGFVLIIIGVAACTAVVTTPPASPTAPLPDAVQWSAQAADARQTAAVASTNAAQSLADAKSAEARLTAAAQATIMQQTVLAAASNRQMTMEASHWQATAQVTYIAMTQAAVSQTSAADARHDQETQTAASYTAIAVHQTQTVEAMTAAAEQAKLQARLDQEKFWADFNAGMAGAAPALGMIGQALVGLIVVAMVLIFLYALGRQVLEYLRARTDAKHAETAHQLLIRDGVGDVAGVLEPIAGGGGFVFRPVQRGLPPPEPIPALPPGPTIVDQRMPPVEQSDQTVEQTAELETRYLDLATKPRGLYIPVGMTYRGERWANLAEIGHLLIAGASGYGKSTLLHAIILSLLDDGRAELRLWDGKRGMHFARYANQHRASVEERDLLPILMELDGEMEERFELFKGRGVVTLRDYNNLVTGAQAKRQIVLVVDEVAQALDEDYGEVKKLLVRLARMAREAGISLVLATQHPSAEVIPSALRTNVGARIAFWLPTIEGSRAIFGSGAARTIPQKRGRMLAMLPGTEIHAQGFLVHLPDMPGAKAISQGDAPADPVAQGPFSDLETKCIHFMLAHDGRFLVTNIAGEVGIDDTEITIIGRRWERADPPLLESYRERGKIAGRRWTQSLIDQIDQLGLIDRSTRSTTARRVRAIPSSRKSTLREASAS